ncbi:VWA domain-containing protein [Winogradskyella sp.]|nr:VWA domain-containing protein [Winogradskyella sp.]
MPKNRLKTKPKSVTVLWDASYSMYYKQAEKELILISDYLKYLNDVNVKLIVFSNTIINTKNFKINAGNSNQLLTFLKTVNYDGGTSYKSLPKIKPDEIILFSDGLHNLGEIELNKNSKLYCVNSVTSANHELLELLATKNDGKYINLNNESNASALSLIKSEAFQFIGVNHENTLYETYPKPKTVINEDFNFSGKYVQKKPIELLFGYGNEITQRIKVDMTSSATSKTVRRL